MKKRFFGKLIAIALAAVTAVPAVSIVSSAEKLGNSVYVFTYTAEYDNETGAIVDAITNELIENDSIRINKKEYNTTDEETETSQWSLKDAFDEYGTRIGLGSINRDKDGKPLKNKYQDNNGGDLIYPTEEDDLFFRNNSYTSAISDIRTEEQRLLNAQIDVLKQRIDEEITVVKNAQPSRSDDETGHYEAQCEIDNLTAMKNVLKYTYNKNDYKGASNDLYLVNSGLNNQREVTELKLSFRTIGGNQYESAIINEYDLEGSDYDDLKPPFIKYTVNNNNSINVNQAWMFSRTSGSTQLNVSWFKDQMWHDVDLGYGWEQFTGTGSGGTSNNDPDDNDYDDDGMPPSSLRYPDGSYVYFAGTYYYPNRAAARNAGYDDDEISRSTLSADYRYATTRRWFNYEMGRYYTSSTAANNAHPGTYYSVNNDNDYYGEAVPPTNLRYASNTGLVFRAGGYYYPNYNAARDAGYSASQISQITPNYAYSSSRRWFNYRNGNYYSTETAAENATSYGDDAYQVTGTGNDSYQNDYYDDPYYQYFMNLYGINPYASGGLGGLPSSGLPNANNTVNTSEPVVTSGSRRYAGWNNVAAVINAASRGTTVNVTMNDTTSVTKAVLDTAKAKGVNIRLTLKNGAVWTIEASKITSTGNKSLSVVYNTGNVPSGLMTAAKKGAISTAQITVGNSGSLGMTAGVTVKFSTNRAGNLATIYRHDAANRRLVAVDRATIGSNGAATFDIKNGGDYVVVIR